MLRSVLMALTLLLAPPAMAAEPFPVTAMMTETGLDRIMEAMRSGIANAPQWIAETDDEDLIAAWRENAEALFDVEALNRQIAEELAAEDWSAAEQETLARFYRSSFGKRVTGFDIAASEMSDDEAAAAYREGEELVRGLPRERRALLERYVAATATLSAAFDRQLLRAGIAISLIAAGAKTPLSSAWANIDRRTDELYQQRIPVLTEESVTNWTATYQTLSDWELGRVVDFIETPAAQRFYMHTAAGVDRALADLLTRLAETVDEKMRTTNI